MYTSTLVIRIIMQVTEDVEMYIIIITAEEVMDTKECILIVHLHTEILDIATDKN
jgi:hypothetical protein